MNGMVIHKLITRDSVRFWGDPQGMSGGVKVSCTCTRCEEKGHDKCKCCKPDSDAGRGHVYYSY